jgi:hypothetical protein
MMSLCWRSHASGVSLLRAFPVLVDEDQGSGGLGDVDSLWGAGGLEEVEGKPLYMLEHVLLLHPRANEVHVFDTARQKKQATATTTSAGSTRTCNSITSPLSPPS